VLGDMPHDRRAHAGAADVVGVVIALRKRVIVAEAHEPCGFARRQQARRRPLTSHHALCIGVG
jgi:hypothetical protein